MAVRVEGADLLARKFSEKPPKIDAAVQAEFRRAGLDLQGKAQSAAPLDQGDLRGSAFTRDANLGVPGVEVGFEGLPYIIVQHEGGWRNFMGRYGPKAIENYTTPGTGAKFLERPFLENKPRYKKAIREAIRRALRNG